MWTHTIDHKQRGHEITSAEKVSFLFRVSGSAENSKLHEAGFTDSCLLSLPPDIQIRKPGRGKTVRTQIKRKQSNWCMLGTFRWLWCDRGWKWLKISFPFERPTCLNLSDQQQSFWFWVRDGESEGGTTWAQSGPRCVYTERAPCKCLTCTPTDALVSGSNWGEDTSARVQHIWTWVRVDFM